MQNIGVEGMAVIGPFPSQLVHLSQLAVMLVIRHRLHRSVI